MSSFPGRNDRYYISQVHQYARTPPGSSQSSIRTSAGSLPPTRTPPSSLHYGRTPPGGFQYARTPPANYQYGRTPPGVYQYGRTPPNHPHPRVLHATQSLDRVSTCANSFIFVVSGSVFCIHRNPFVLGCK